MIVPKHFALFACVAVLVLPGADTVAPVTSGLPARQTLQYGVEWRLVRAGTARLAWTPAPGSGYQGDLELTSAGLVSKLYRVNDHYRVNMNASLCAESVLLKAEEGKRRRETNITFNPGKLRYVERDLIKNNVVLEKELQTPPCVHEYLGALAKMRSIRLEPGQSTQIAMTDGKKVASVKVDAQERETVRIGNETYNTTRYEVHMFNEVLVNRKARMYMWITDDNRRLPVQLRLKLSVLVGTITLQLEKVE